MDCVFLFEVEIKAPLDEIESIEKKLHDLGAIFQAKIRQSDIYFQHPNRNFAITDEALRIRETDQSAFLTYKGPKIDSTTKTREEIELEIENPKYFEEILKRLGFITVIRVNKSRKIYNLDKFTICLDSVNELGFFIEIETEVLQYSDIPLAKDEAFSILKQLNIPRKKLERLSYLELLYLKKSSTPS